MTSSPFTARRLQSVARIAGYALLSEFIISLLSEAFPLSGSPERQFAQVESLLDLSSLPLLAVVLLLGGFTGAAVTDWEWLLGRGLKPMLALASLLYFLLIPGNLMLASRIETSGNQVLRQQFAETNKAMDRFRGLLATAPDAGSLRALIQAQPELNQTLNTPDSPFGSQVVTFDQQRGKALLLMDRMRANFVNSSTQQIADAQGKLRKQSLRLNLLAICHGLFFGAAWVIWPRMTLKQRSADDSHQHP